MFLCFFVLYYGRDWYFVHVLCLFFCLFVVVIGSLCFFFVLFHARLNELQPYWLSSFPFKLHITYTEILTCAIVFSSLCLFLFAFFVVVIGSLCFFVFFCGRGS